MKSDLPEPEEYHRPARARELRDQADRLERRSKNTGRIVVGVFVAFYLACGGALAGWLSVIPLLLIIPTAALAGLSVGHLNRRAERLRAEADTLEAEHAARYGAHPPRAQE